MGVSEARGDEAPTDPEQTMTTKLNALASQKFDGVQVIYSGKHDPNHGPGWFIRYCSGFTRWIGRNASAAAEWINNA